ncbi:MAG: Bug family tripartite tricarboxylate transporter substrate binding protein [Burkholderiales bacterium]
MVKKKAQAKKPPSKSFKRGYDILTKMGRETLMLDQKATYPDMYDMSVAHPARVKEVSNMQPLLNVSLAAALACACAFASAQPKDAPYPAKPVRCIVPFPPGGTADIQARMLFEKLGPRLGQQIIIDNRGGANGSIGMELASRAPADGYTIVLATVGTWVINPYLYKLSYEVLDFAPIIHVATTPGVLIVHPSLPVKSVKELIALARARPGELTYGSAGIGGFGHMSAELFSVLAKVKMSHIPYKGTGPSTADLLGGHIQILFNSAVPSMPHIKSGKVRALATTGAKRMSTLPELPTVAEAGLAGYENATWTGIGAPPRTPRAVTERLNKELNVVLQLPEIQQAMHNNGSDITGGTPDDFHAILKKELAKFGKVVKAAGIKPEQ